MTASGLQQQVGDFARVVDATLCAVLGGSAHLQATTDEGDNFVVTTTGEGVPLTKAGQDFLKLRVSFLCGWDGPQRFVRVDRSEIHLLPHDSTRPLLRYEFSQKALNRPGKSGDSVPWEGWSHVREYVEEVPGRVA